MNTPEPPPNHEVHVPHLVMDDLEPKKVTGRKRQLVFRVLVISVLLHLIGGMGAAFWIVTRYFSKPPAVFQVRKAPVVPPTEREHRVSMESFDSMTPRPSVTDRITALKPTKLSLPELPQLPVNQMLAFNPNPTFIDQMVNSPTSAAGQGMGGSGGGAGVGKGSAFGFSRRSGGMLVGRFYDLKRFSASRESDVTPANYGEFIAKFLQSGWDQTLLEKFYRAPKTLYLSHVYIPLISAGEAPDAYGVARTVEPTCWVAHYKGTVSAPYSDNIRFWGYSDDMILVRLGGQFLLNGSRHDVTEALRAPPEVRQDTGIRMANAGLQRGPWFKVTQGKPIEMEILIGERPGGSFCAFLAMERQSAPAANPPADLELFRLADATVDINPDPALMGPVNDKAPVWQQGGVTQKGPGGIDYDRLGIRR